VPLLVFFTNKEPGYSKTDSMNERKKSTYLLVGSLIGFLLGVALGVMSWDTSFRTLPHLIPYADVFAKSWIVILIILVVPLVVTNLFVSFITMLHEKLAGKLVFNGLLVHLGLLIACTLLSVSLSYGFTHDLNVALSTPNVLTPEVSQQSGLRNVLAQLTSLQSNVAQLIVPAILVTILFSMGTFWLPNSLKSTLIAYSQRISTRVFALLRIVFYALPVSVGCLAFVVSSQSGTMIFGIVGLYVVGVCVVLSCAILFLYVMAFFFGCTPVTSFIRALLPAQLVAISTCSSLASLPALLTSTKKLGIPVAVAGFGVPVFVSFFRINLMVANPFSFFLLSELYNIPIALPGFLIFLGLMLITSFASPGLPQMGNVYSLPVFLAAGIPLEGILLLKAFDSIPDIFKTLLNVTEIGLVMSIVMRWQARVLPELYSVPGAHNKFEVP
jgi:Na+/H+-dicarboxylate symporter